MKLTLTQFNEYLDRLSDVLEMEHGSTDHRSRVERVMRRQKREADRG